MPLHEIEITIDDSALPDDVVSFLREADFRINKFIKSSPASLTGFVPSDFSTVYRALHAIIKRNLAPGISLCEWGSGFGVVASLAAMLGFQAYGIEIERVLVDASQKLADDFDLSVEFVLGSFVPSGGEKYAEKAYAEEASTESSWLVTDADSAYDELGLDSDDFDIVFAYPWPGEEYLVESLFKRYAANEALLLMYGQFDSVRLLRNVSSVTSD